MLDIKKISFSYKKDNNIFDNIDIQFKENIVYGIVGKNGVGKTTFLKLITNLLSPKTGNIYLDDKHHIRDKKFYQNNFVFSPEEPDFLPYLTGKEWLLFVLAAYHKSFDHLLIQELLDVFNFNELENEIKTYSLGMKKKLSMIISIMVNTKCMLFDESLSGIDPFTTTNIYKYIQTLKKNKIIIISSHSKDLVDNCLDEILFLQNGIFNMIDNFDEIFKLANHGS